ncbi:LANO_0G07514g1_1 [Lachancea nothofagi CBS 11611]|uniref:P-type Na(+) transporter n=1 Tax=Lachancea nothofagi CBS 11611 TaxID=1266666 RepID=A0A1G4KHV8_9SACH|nr:LANO_0G07514g1_1 [Lachancea nothofagi CBS 11611]
MPPPEALQQPFHTLSVRDTAAALSTDTSRGLNSPQIAAARAMHGENSLGDDSKVDFKAILLHQICNAMIMVLFISMVITLAIRDWISGGVIAFVVFINVAIGSYQEYKASKTMSSLKSLSTPSAHVIRDGSDVVIPSKDLVPGDLCVVKAGDTVPADLRLIEGINFETDEALLTGESLPIAKDAVQIYSATDDTPVGDRLNLAYASSTVSKGRATGIVISTGLNSEVGKIAKSLQGDNSLISNDKSKSFSQNAYITFKTAVGAFLGTSVGTPLHRKLSKLAVLLFFVAVVFALVVMATQKYNVNKEVAIYAICVAISMIPSSLVVVLTITMSVGSKIMATKNVVVRKLDSLEALGAVNDVCSDKTGTLTQGRMILKQAWIPSFGTVTVSNSNEPFNPTVGTTELIPRFSPHDYKHDENEDVGIIQGFKDAYYKNSLPTELNPELFTNWLKTATLANIAQVYQDPETQDWKAHGDPTEIAIQVFAHRMDLPRSVLTLEGQNESEDEKVQSSSSIPNYKHLAEFPFDSSVKRMSAVYQNTKENNKHCVYTKGAFERVLSCCTHWLPASDSDESNAKPMTEEDKKWVFENVEVMSSEGLRVLAFATKSFTEQEAQKLGDKLIKSRDFVENDLIFQGLVGIYDPPRQETAAAVKQFHKAGINIHMLTGDFPGTAKAIAQEVGILPRNLYHYPEEVVQSMVMTATQFDKLSEEEIDELPLLPLVIARCSPATKVKMIEALHRREKFCAMTGDGVNDSPSLKIANVGIAMGINGSDVAKDASDIVLSDDNFASILNAVEEGRRMTDNIQKFVLQLLAENVAQALYLMIGLAFLDQDHLSVFPLSPVEVLWIIVVTSCFPAMGLGLEKSAADIMEKPPKDSKAGIFTWEIISDMFVYGIWMAGCCLGAFVTVVYGKGNGQLGYNCNNEYTDSCHFVFRGRAAAFATMTWCALILAWEVIDLRRSFFKMQPETDTPYTQWLRDIWSNQFLFWSVVGGFVSVFPVVYIPVINHDVFKHAGIGYEWGLAVAFTVIFWAGAELYKFFKRSYYKNQDRADNPEKDLESKRVHDPFEKYNTSYSGSFSGSTALQVTIVDQK